MGGGCSKRGRGRAWPTLAPGCRAVIDHLEGLDARLAARAEAEVEVLGYSARDAGDGRLDWHLRDTRTISASVANVLLAPSRSEPALTRRPALGAQPPLTAGLVPSPALGGSTPRRSPSQ